MSKHFKMYITITDVVEEKRINLAYPIQNLDSSKEVTVISMFTNNVQYQIREPLKVLLIMNKEKQLPEGVSTDRELYASVGRKLITMSRYLSWHASRRWLSAWMNSTILTTWKTEDSAASCLGIM